ncbi:MAG TPA: FkbM family methyltransferase [Thermoanaerobaculia bacterium]|nr:FkbM family methyltransferase [Thermoanaerobaculia bacterium]
MSLARSLAELLSRHVTLRRRLPTELGGSRLFVTPDSALRYWLPGNRWLDPALVGWSRELVEPGMQVWDVGANVGVFSFLAASLAGPAGSVLALEADPALCALMQRAIEEGHQGAPVSVLHAAVDRELGEVHLNIARRGRSASFVNRDHASTQHGGSRHRIRVPARTLDSLLSDHPPPHLLKIDVEGSELNALEGAREVLANARPTLLCEVHAANSERVSAILRLERYVLFDAQVPRRDRRPLERAPGETLAVPTERRTLQGPHEPARSRAGADENADADRPALD